MSRRALAQRPPRAEQDQSRLPAGTWVFQPPSAAEGAKLFWARPGDLHGSIFITCERDGRTFHAVFATVRDFPENQRVAVTVSNSYQQSTTIQTTMVEGPLAVVGTELPFSHPLLRLLRNGEGRLRLTSPGGEVSMNLSLSGSANPVGRFEASCRPS